LKESLEFNNEQAESSPNEITRESSKLRAKYIENQLRVAQEVAEKKGKDIK
jgi:hypothetical protein